MVQQVVWTKTAQRTFDSIMHYFILNDKQPTAEWFFHQVYREIEKVRQHPTRNRRVPGTKGIRFAVFGKHYELFYRTKGNTLIISNFFDTRQNPDKRPF